MKLIAISKVRQAINRLRFAPRAYLGSLFRHDLLDAEDVADLDRLIAVWGAPTAKSLKLVDADRTAVLVSMLPLPYCQKMEGTIGRALQDRGWRVVVLTNSGVRTLAEAYHRKLHGFEVFVLEDFLEFGNASEIKSLVRQQFQGNRLDIATLKRVQWHGVPVGLHGLATLLSATPDGRINDTPDVRKRLARILRSSMLLVDAADAFLRHVRPKLMLSVEKGFVGTCEPYYAAIREGIDYVQWVGCHEPESVMLKRFHRGNLRDHPFSISEDSWRWIRTVPWRESYRDAVRSQFVAGYQSGMWFKYKGLTEEQKFSERDVLVRSLALDPQKKTAVIYSHILNDANLFYGEDLFEDGYEQWLVETVRAAQKNDQLNWVLKLHPANRNRNLRLGYVGEYGELLALKNAFGSIPSFLKVVYPDEDVSPFSFFQLSDYGITVRGTVGLELPCYGVPVLTAGSGRYAGKGFTYDSASAAEYKDKIQRLDQLVPLSELQVRLAILYAYFVFMARPAKYDKVFSDVYGPSVRHRRHRDIILKADSMEQIIHHPQVARIVDFLESRELDDFLDMSTLPELDTMVKHG